MRYLTIEQRESIRDAMQIINEALAKLRSPEYETCIDCEDRIPFVFLSEDRLETLCRKCAQRRHLSVFVPAEM